MPVIVSTSTDYQAQPSVQGVLYIAFGEKYRSEACASMASVRKSSPGLPIAVITDREWDDQPQPDNVLVRGEESGFASKPFLMHESPFDQTLFLDTDTFVARDIRPVFGLLDYYDFGVYFDGPQLNEPDGLELHTQCNSGVVLFQKNTRVAELFSLWRQYYREASDRLSGPAADPRGLGDQRFLAIAVARSKVRPVHLAAYLNFALFCTITTYSPPVVYHGRISGLNLIDKEITGGWKPRTDWHVRLWLPNVSGLLPAGIRRSDPLLALALLLRRAFNTVRRRLRDGRRA